MEPRTAHNTVSTSLIRWWTGLSRELQGPETSSDIPWGLVTLTLSSARSLLPPLPLGVSWCNSVINVWKMWGKNSQRQKKTKNIFICTFWISLLRESLNSSSCRGFIRGHVSIWTKNVMEQADKINKSPFLDHFCLKSIKGAPGRNHQISHC